MSWNGPARVDWAMQQVLELGQPKRRKKLPVVLFSFYGYPWTPLLAFVFVWTGTKV